MVYLCLILVKLRSSLIYIAIASSALMDSGNLLVYSEEPFKVLPAGLRTAATIKGFVHNLQQSVIINFMQCSAHHTPYWMPYWTPSHWQWMQIHTISIKECWEQGHILGCAPVLALQIVSALSICINQLVTSEIGTGILLLLEYAGMFTHFNSGGLLIMAIIVALLLMHFAAGMFRAGFVVFKDIWGELLSFHLEAVVGILCSIGVNDMGELREAAFWITGACVAVVFCISWSTV